jgi:HD-GYP domain-containing protein (c-di-GMP phosphodiesterase class II)
LYVNEKLGHPPGGRRPAAQRLRGSPQPGVLKRFSAKTERGRVRLLPLNRVPDGALLGRDVSSGRSDGLPLLRKGTTLSARYKESLLRAGIHAVYVDDEETKGIEPKPAISAETRSAATAAVSRAFDGAREAIATGRPMSAEAVEELNGIAARMAVEVAQNSEFAVALADLSAADGYTLQHSVDVAALGLLIGHRLFRQRGYLDYRGRRSWERIDMRLVRLGLGLLLHDIGKLAVPTEILNKPGKLTPEEWDIMKTHPLAGVELLRSDLISPLIKAVVRSHHERWDGGGYPDGKAELEINELARIAAVADVYDAVTSERVYAAARPAHVGVRIIRQGREAAFDAEIADAFSKIVPPFPAGDPIELSNGMSGVVADVSLHALDRPVVRVLSHGAPHDFSLAEHPRVKIAGWEGMDPPESAADWPHTRAV